jgi:hypothetical protein
MSWGDFLLSSGLAVRHAEERGEFTPEESPRTWSGDEATPSAFSTTSVQRNRGKR